MTAHNTAGAVWGTLVQAERVNIHVPKAEYLPPRQLPAPRRFFDHERSRAYLDRAWSTRHGPSWVVIQGHPG